MATAIWDQDRTPLSRRLADSFVQSAYFDIKQKADSFRDVRRSLDLGRVKAGLVIPPDFARDLLAGRRAELQLLIDGTDSNPANTALNTSQAIVTVFMQNEGLVPIAVTPVSFRPRMWYNPDLKSSFFMIPGLVGLLIQILIPMITATAIVREKERGNIEQLLVTPIKPYELIIGKLVPYAVISLGIAFMILAAAGALFAVPIRGNLLLLFGSIFLFVIVCLGIGILASTIAENQQQAAQVVLLLAPPSVLLSGFVFPRETMPWIIYAIGDFIPLTYFLKIIRGIVLKGLGFFDIIDQLIPLGVMAVLFLGLSIVRFHKRLK